MTYVITVRLAESNNIANMKVRICFLAMFLAPLIYYGAIQLAPAGRAATVSSGFHQLGKYALGKIETAQDAETSPEFDSCLADAERAVTIANNAAHTDADRRDYTRLASYLQDVKQDHMLWQADPSAVDHTQTDAAKESCERVFN